MNRTLRHKVLTLRTPAPLRLRVHIFSIAFLVLSLVGCITDQTLAPPIDPLEKWNALGVHNYTIDQVRVCFCGTSGDTVRLTIKADTIFSGTRLANGAAVTGPTLHSYRSITELFTILKTTHPDSVVVSYNAESGYPEALDLYPQLHPVDGGVTYLTSRFLPK